MNGERSAGQSFQRQQPEDTKEGEPEICGTACHEQLAISRMGSET